MDQLQQYLRQEHKKFEHIEPDFDRWMAEIERIKQQEQEVFISPGLGLTCLLIGLFVVGAFLFL